MARVLVIEDDQDLFANSPASDRAYTVERAGAIVKLLGYARFAVGRSAAPAFGWPGVGCYTVIPLPSSKLMDAPL